jgi:hypothetical protein
MPRFRIIYQNSNIEAPQGRFDIGRSLECNLVLDDPSVSRIHATIIRHNDRLLLEDRGSRNGCTLNGIAVSGTSLLQDGDIIGIGHQEIRISQIRDVRPDTAGTTTGLSACQHCGAWSAIADDFCSQCGHPFRELNNGRATDTVEIAVRPQQPIIRLQDEQEDTINAENLLSGLAQKALSKNRTEEAWKFTRKLMDNIRTFNSNRETPEVELEKVAGLVIEIAVQSHSPERISDLFTFFKDISRLIPRKAVDQLYSVAKGTGYRTTTELHEYMERLTAMADNFSPSEKFIYRRIEGLVGLCN